MFSNVFEYSRAWQVFMAKIYLCDTRVKHYNDRIMSAMASQITSRTIVYSTHYSGADQRKHQSSASLGIVWGIHRWPVNSPHKRPVTRKIFPFDDVIIKIKHFVTSNESTVKWMTCLKKYAYFMSLDFMPKILSWINCLARSGWLISIKKSLPSRCQCHGGCYQKHQ